MKKIILSCLLALVLLSAACAAPTAAPEETPMPEPPMPAELVVPSHPVLILDWTGTGGDFRDFTVSGNSWVIIWEFNPASWGMGEFKANYFGLTVDQVELVANIANVQSRKTQTWTVRGRGRHHLDVNSMEGTWHIYVYDYR